VQLSKEFGLLSSLTTFVTVEHRTLEERNAGRPAIRRVPVALAQGWGGVHVGGAAAAAMPAGMVMASRAPQQASASPGQFPMRRSRISRLDKTMDHTIDRLRDSLDRSLDQPSDKDIGLGSSGADAGMTRGLHALLSTQSAAGAFERNAEVTALAKTAFPNWDVQLAELERACVAMFAAVSDPEKTQAVATVEALLLLRTVFADESAAWRRAAFKALRYLAKLSGRSAPEIDDWLKAACGAALR
jgi:hypothetical protein